MAGQQARLSRTRALLGALGNPERQLRFIHIAGTNGKGSTAACIASCLQAAGWRVGLYTSPYINRFNERMQVNGVPISDEDLEALVDQIRPIANTLTDSPRNLNSSPPWASFTSSKPIVTLWY